MRVYHAYVSATNTVSTTVPMWNLTGGTTFQVRLLQIIIGASTTPADFAARFVIRRTSVAGTTSTTVTPNPIESSTGIIAANAVFATAWSVNPTITANSDLLWIPMNARATPIWTPPPDLKIQSDAAAGDGLAMLSAVASTAQAYDFTVFWAEE